MKTIILITMLMAISSLLSAQLLVNNGGSITMEPTNVMVVHGDITNQLNGAMNNNGQLRLSGDWTNNAVSGNLLQGSTGTVSFDGTSTQNIDGSAKTWFNNLAVNNAVNIQTETSVASNLGLSGGSINLGAADLKMESGATISGAGPTQYVVAGSNGRLVQEVQAADVLFPVGTATSYVPVTLNNSGNTDNFGVSVFSDVLDGGTTGSTIPEIDDCVNNTWNITEETAGGSDLSIAVQWNASDEGITFDRSQSAIGHYNGSWDPDGAGPAQGTNPYTQIRNGITSLSAFAVGDTESPMAITLALTIDLAAFLEGPFNGTNMNTSLNTGGLLPLAQPYNAAPWNYAGTESVASIPANAVDWVLLELRDAADAISATDATVIDRQAAFVLADGTVVATDGASYPEFGGSVSQNLFVLIYHRNHLAVMSANPVTQSGGLYSWNFTTGSEKGYGDTAGQNEISTGIWGLVGGDADANGTIGASDKTAWASEAGSNGYTGSDFDMNTQVNNVDKNDIWVENNTKTSQVPE